MIDNRALWDLEAQSLSAGFGAAINNHRASLGLPPVNDVRDYVFTDRPWLAADPTLAPWEEPADLDVVQTGAWILPDDRPLPGELQAFLNAGAPPVYVGFGSIPMRDAQTVARPAVDAVRAQGRRVLVSRGWADLALIHDRDDWPWRPRPAHERPPWPARFAPTGRRWPRDCCSTPSAPRRHRRPREPHLTIKPGNAPGARQNQPRERPDRAARADAPSSA